MAIYSCKALLAPASSRSPSSPEVNPGRPEAADTAAKAAAVEELELDEACFSCLTWVTAFAGPSEFASFLTEGPGVEGLLQNFGSVV